MYSNFILYHWIHELFTVRLQRRKTTMSRMVKRSWVFFFLTLDLLKYNACLVLSRLEFPQKLDIIYHRFRRIITFWRIKAVYSKYSISFSLNCITCYAGGRKVIVINEISVTITTWFGWNLQTYYGNLFYVFTLYIHFCTNSITLSLISKLSAFVPIKTGNEVHRFQHK